MHTPSWDLAAAPRYLTHMRHPARQRLLHTSKRTGRGVLVFLRTERVNGRGQRQGELVPTFHTAATGCADNVMGNDSLSTV